MDHASDAPTLADIRAAAARIADHALRTPVLRSDALDELAGCRLHFKCENLQRGGAFKFRGACNAVLSLTDRQAGLGVVTQSSGNHGAAIALACRTRGIPATVVVPHSAPRIKLDAIREYGARIIHCEVSQAARDAATADVLRDSGANYIHPFNDARVIAGQATATLELFDQVPSLDMLLAPVSGGGLLSATAIAGHGLKPGLIICGAEPAGASDAHDSLVSGQRVVGRRAETICDGLRAELGTLTFRIIRDHVDAIVLASDAQAIAAMRLLWDRLKLVVEVSSAVALAAILADPERFAGRDVGVILSGGNVDLDTLPWSPATDADQPATSSGT